MFLWLLIGSLLPSATHPSVRTCSEAIVCDASQEFAVFMWLLKSSRKGLPLPGAPLSPAQLQQFIGIGASPEQSSLQYQVDWCIDIG